LECPRVLLARLPKPAARALRPATRWITRIKLFLLSNWDSRLPHSLSSEDCCINCPRISTSAALTLLLSYLDVGLAFHGYICPAVRPTSFRRRPLASAN